MWGWQSLDRATLAWYEPYKNGFGMQGWVSDAIAPGIFFGVARLHKTEEEAAERVQAFYQSYLQLKEKEMVVHRHITVVLDMTRQDIEARLKAQGIDPTPQVVSEVIQLISRTAIDAGSHALVDAIERRQRAEKGEEDA